MSTHVDIGNKHIRDQCQQELTCEITHPIGHFEKKNSSSSFSSNKEVFTNILRYLSTYVDYGSVEVKLSTNFVASFGQIPLSDEQNLQKSLNLTCASAELDINFCGTTITKL